MNQAILSQFVSLNQINEAFVNQLIQSYESLLAENKHEANLTLEQQKLEIIQSTERQLRELLSHHVNGALRKDPSDVKEKISMFQAILQKIAYYFLIFFGLFQDIAGSFIFSITLFSLIPSISQPALMITATIYTVLDSILFYAFEVSLLKEALGIPYESTELEQHIDIHRQQITWVTIINDHLSKLPVIYLDPNLYEQYARLATQFNQDLCDRDKAMSEYQESVTKKILKISLLTFGALSSIAASCFWADSILSIWAASMIGTPVGWGLVALTVIAGLGYYFAMDGSSIVQLVNPDYKSYLALREESTKFRSNYNDDLHHKIGSIQKEHHRAPTQETATQTDLNEPHYFAPVFRNHDPKVTSEVNQFRLEKPFALGGCSML